MNKSKILSDYPNKSDDIDDAVTKRHDQNTDTILDEGGANEISAETIKSFVDLGYERDTWTPSFFDSGITINQIRTAEYIRIGDLVTVLFDFEITENTGGSGSAFLVLPFVGTETRNGILLRRRASDGQASSVYATFTAATGGGARVLLRGTGDTSFWTYANTALQAGNRFTGQITYIRA